VILIDAHRRHDWLIGAVNKRLREEFDKLQVGINDEKSRMVDLDRGESFGFLASTSAICAAYAEHGGHITRRS
jgi:RNA-directed DNA polymerase